MKITYHPAGTQYAYETYRHNGQMVTEYEQLGQENLAIVTCEETGELLECITPDTPEETAQNVATWGNLRIWAGIADHPPSNIRTAIQELRLYADFHGVEVEE